MVVLELNRGVSKEGAELVSGLGRWTAAKAFDTDCKHKNVVYENGQLVCRECGTVISDHPFDCEVGYWPSLNEVEEPVRVSAEDVRREREFQAKHRDAKDWCVKVEEESRKNTTNIDPDRADGSTKLLEKLRGNTRAIRGDGWGSALSTKAPTKGSMVEENYVRELTEKLMRRGVFENETRARVFAGRLANLLERRVKVQGIEVPTVDSVIKTLECMFHGVPNVKGCEQPSHIVGAIRDALNITRYYEDIIRYVIRAKFGKEPNDEVVKYAKNYLYTLDTWIKVRGMSNEGIDEYPSKPIVAAAALAIAKIETGDPKDAIEVLNNGDTKSIVTRLKLDEFLNWLNH